MSNDIVARLRKALPSDTPSEDWDGFDPLIAEAAAEIERLRERLEMTHAWRMIDGTMTKVAVELGSIPDGIECRNETIKLQDREIERLRRSAGTGSQQTADAWRTMESAPKDGTPILAFRFGGYMEAAIWNGWRKMYEWHPMFRPQGRFTEQPQYWSPLPAPPKAEGHAPTPPSAEREHKSPPALEAAQRIVGEQETGVLRAAQDFDYDALTVARALLASPDLEARNKDVRPDAAGEKQGDRRYVILARNPHNDSVVGIDKGEGTDLATFETEAEAEAAAAFAPACRVWPYVIVKAP